MKQSKIYVLQEKPITSAIFSLSLPSVLSMMVSILYNLTDTFFIGKLNDPVLVAAVSISLPLFTFQMALAGIFGNGGGSYLSRLLGRSDYQGARETATTAIVTSAIVSVIIAIGGTLLIPSFLKAVGASDQTYQPAYNYMFWIMLGTPFIMLKFTLVQLLRAEGAAKAAMAGLMLGTGLNIVLDPLFIFVFDMSVTGAAIATIIGQAVATGFFAYYYLSGRSIASPALRFLRFDLEIYKQILFIGIPSSLSQIMMGIGNMISYRLGGYYSDLHVAALGVASRVFSIPSFVFIGISVGVQPLIGFNYGAHNYPRMKKAIRQSITICLWLSVFFLLLFVFIPEQLITVFNKDKDVITYGTSVLGAYIFGIPVMAMGMILMTSLQSMGKALHAFIIAISRQGIVYIPLVLLLNLQFSFEGLVLALPLADMITTSLSFAFVYHILKNLKSHKPTQAMEFVTEEVSLVG